MAHKLYRVVDFQLVDQYQIRVKFSDGAERTINFEPVLHGEVFGPLRELSRFRQVKLNAAARTLVWPTGADFDPETLYRWDDEEMAALGRRWVAQAEFGRAVES
ncbi:MAG: DUF2442 domain-containing protein [Caldilineaceae bacterium]